MLKKIVIDLETSSSFAKAMADLGITQETKINQI